MVKTGEKYRRYLLLFTLLILGGMVLHVSAQTEEETPWSTPLNLSSSGSSIKPTMVVDPSGQAHVFWQDPFSGFMYASGDGRSWSEPVLAQAPFVAPPPTGPGADDALFEGYTPTLLAGPNNILHAFWIGDENFLLYSRAEIANVTLLEGWTPPQVVARMAVAFDVRRDADGRLHLVYVRAPGDVAAPAGVYYRQASDGVVWDESATLLYQSDYLRTVEATTAHVQLVVAGFNVYAAWDDPALDAVYFVRATENGRQWEEPVVIDQRQTGDPPDAAGPAGIQIAVRDSDVHLTWRATHQPEPNCGLYHQWSDSNALTWADPSLIFVDNRGCAEANRLWPAEDGLVFSLTQVVDDQYLQAWDGNQWTDPVLQAPLGEFVHPQTFRPVSVSCWRMAVTPDDHLLAVVCGGGGAEDIWVLQRPLGDREEWSDQFRATPVWSTPDPFTLIETRLSAIELVVDGDGRWHAFWNQTDISVEDSSLAPFGEGVGDGLYYARLEDDLWSSPRAVLASPTGKTDRPAVAVTDDGLLLTVWSGGVSGGVYFSRAPVEEAVSAAGWESPHLLPAPIKLAGEWPDIAVGADGTVYVVYTIPFNEARGVYLTRSQDEGATWTTPVQIFNGAASEWSMVGRPRLTLLDDEELNVVWSRRTAPETQNGIALSYAKSIDRGESWTAPQTLTETPVRWHDVVGLGQRTLHLVWWGHEEERFSLWHRYSLDAGVSWSRAVRISDPTVRGGMPALVQNMAREPYLAQLAEDNTGQLLLQEWSWNGERWQHPRDAFVLAKQGRNAHLLSAAVASQGVLGAIYAVEVPAQESDPEQHRQQIAYTQRSLPLPEMTPTSLPTLTPTPVPTLIPTETPVPSPTPLPTFFPNNTGSGGISIGSLSTNDTLGSILFSIIPAVVIVGIVFVVGLYWRKRW